MLLLLALAAAAPALATPPGHDVVVMRNGDRFTGKFKKMDGGVLFIQTSYYAGKIQLDWRQVSTLEAADPFQVLLADGRRYIARVRKLAGPDCLLLLPAGNLRVASRDVVWMHPEKPTFLRQLTGAVGGGGGYTSGNRQANLNVNSNVAYATTTWQAKALYNASFSGQSGAPKTNQQNASIDYERFLRGRNFLIANSDFLHSRQQQLALLSAAGGGYGYYFLRRTSAYFRAYAGADYLREAFTTPGHPVQQNAVGLVGADLDLLKFNVGEFQSSLLALPNVTTRRFRLGNSNTLTISLPDNFSFNFNAWDYYDSGPPAPAKHNEFGLSTSIGYSF